MIVTAPLPEWVLRHAEYRRKVEARAAWQQRKQKGEEAGPPPGPNPAEQLLGPAAIGLVGGLISGIIAQLATDLIGFLFHFHAGYVWLWGWLLAGAAIFVVGIHVWDGELARDEKRVRDNQRTISDWHGRTNMQTALRAAQIVLELWPVMPVNNESAAPRLHTALWELSGELAERQQYVELLTTLQAAKVGVPPGHGTGLQLAEQIRRAETLRQAHEAKAARQLEQVTVLAQRCQRFCDEQAAIKRAQDASTQAFAVLGPVPAATPSPADEERARQAQLEAIREAFDALPAPIMM